MTGHSVPMKGKRLRDQLQLLADHFDELAVPRHGRYVPSPAITDENGIVSVPPPAFNPMPLIAVGAVAAVGAAIMMNRSRSRDS